MSNILQEIESQIAGLKTAVTKSNVGIVREIGDGAAKIEGLSDVMLNEMIEFPGGVTARMPRLPLEVGDHDFSLRRQAPSIGQHSAEVLGEAGISMDEIAALIEQGVVKG
jgi:crotonobetainyl-CoA:carnitine CoA-transferase CaiB-like acyl-CoA transferase